MTATSPTLCRAGRVIYARRTAPSTVVDFFDFSAPSAYEANQLVMPKHIVN